MKAETSAFLAPRDVFGLGKQEESMLGRLKPILCQLARAIIEHDLAHANLAVLRSNPRFATRRPRWDDPTYSAASDAHHSACNALDSARAEAGSVLDELRDLIRKVDDNLGVFSEVRFGPLLIDHLEAAELAIDGRECFLSVEDELLHLTLLTAALEARIEERAAAARLPIQENGSRSLVGKQKGRP